MKVLMRSGKAMSRSGGWLMGSIILGMCLLFNGKVEATQPGRCTTISTVTASQILSTSPARVCSVEFFATAANGWAYVYDGAVRTQTSAGLAEPGAATSGNHEYVSFGEEGFVTDQGLGVDIKDGRVFIRWGR